MVQVHLERVHPIRRALLDEPSRRPKEVTDVVHQDVGVTLGGNARRGATRGDVDLEEGDRTECRAALFVGQGWLRDVQVHADDVGTVRREHPGDTGADPSAASGDHRRSTRSRGPGRGSTPPR